MMDKLIEFVCEIKVDQQMNRLWVNRNPQTDKKMTEKPTDISEKNQMTWLLQAGEQKPYRDEHSAPFGWKTRSQTNLAFDVYNSRWENNVDLQLEVGNQR